jgi:hypothetical protein
MSQILDRAKEIFLAAVKMSPDHWTTYLNQACGTDDALRERVANLLQAHRESGSFLRPAIGATVALDGEANRTRLVRKSLGRTSASSRPVPTCCFSACEVNEGGTGGSSLAFAEGGRALYGSWFGHSGTHYTRNQ